MRKLILVAHSSFDGFVAGPRGEFDNFIGGEENLEFVCGLTDNADAALFGRRAYELLNSDWPTAAERPGATKAVVKYSNWYNRVPKYVLSTTLPPGSSENTHIIGHNITDEINKLKQPGEHGSKTILMFGGPTAVYSMMKLNLLDAFWLLIHPVIFGEGISLFKHDVRRVIRLDLADTQRLSNGMVALLYFLEK
ncbi:MAG TPA: dihydrofolate reductase family protein [Chitinophagaceae bacterium]|nr:dihydrofolate reductase family protein [Chitinophagaceae bacterium]